MRVNDGYFALVFLILGSLLYSVYTIIKTLERFEAAVLALQ